MVIRICLMGFILVFSATAFAQTSQPDSPRFSVTGYEVSGENPLSVNATNKILTPFLGQHEGLEGLQAAAEAFEQSIRNQGNSFHRVILPPQTLRDGKVELQVIEFKLGEVLIEGNKHFSKHNIHRSLPNLKQEHAPDLQILARNLRLANLHPSKQIALSFKESDKEQAVDAIIKVKDRSPHSIFTVLQNTGSDQTGDFRLSLGYQYSNLFNRDHSVALIYTTAPDDTDAVSQVGLSYRLPIYSASSVVNFSYTDSNVESGVIEEFFQVSGKGTAASLSYTYSMPSSGRYQHNLSLSYDDKLYENELYYDGSAIPPADECITSDGKVRTNPYGLTYKGIARGIRNGFGFSLGAYSNKGSGRYSNDVDYNCIREQATSDWSAIRYSLNYDLRFANDWSFSFRHQGQVAGEPMIPGEQFGLGGATSIRGYDERSILGDDGWQTNLEIWTPSFANKSMNALLFYDFGHVESEIIDETVSEFDPAGFGLGLRWNWQRQFSLRADIASALEPYGDTQDGDTAFHLSIYYRF